jgi:hypothetical protein
MSLLQFPLPEVRDGIVLDYLLNNCKFDAVFRYLQLSRVDCFNRTRLYTLLQRYFETMHARSNVKITPWSSSAAEMYATMYVCNVRRDNSNLEFDAVLHLGIPVSGFAETFVQERLDVQPVDTALLELIHFDITLERKRKSGGGVTLCVQPRPALKWSHLATVGDEERETASIVHVASGATAANISLLQWPTRRGEKQEEELNELKTVSCNYHGNYLFAIVVHCKRT